MSVYGRPAVLTRPVIFATAFMSFFSVVIALFKVNIFLASKMWVIKWFCHIKATYALGFAKFGSVVFFVNYNDTIKADFKLAVQTSHAVLLQFRTAKFLRLSET